MTPGSLKKGKGGWIKSSDLVVGGFINYDENRQPFSHLRHASKPWLIEGDGEKFIKCDRSKGYRLSTHPDFVKWDREKLIDHPDPKVMGLLKRGK